MLDAVPPYFSQAILSREPARGGRLASVSFLIPVMPLDEQEVLVDEIRAELDPPGAAIRRRASRPRSSGCRCSRPTPTPQLAGSRYWLTLAGLLAVALVLLAVYRSPRARSCR